MAGRFGIRSNARNRQPESLNVNQRAHASATNTDMALTNSPAEQANMADTEVKSSASSGANEPPTPSPSTAPASPLSDAPMRVDHVQPLPMPSSAYQALAELNRGFEQQTHNLNALHRFNFFPEELLIAWGSILRRLQAESSLRLIDTIRDRVMNNALYFDRLCWTRERQLEDPDDVLIKAKQRKRELAEEQRRGTESEEGE